MSSPPIPFPCTLCVACYARPITSYLEQNIRRFHGALSSATLWREQHGSLSRRLDDVRLALITELLLGTPQGGREFVWAARGAFPAQPAPSHRPRAQPCWVRVAVMAPEPITGLTCARGPCSGSWGETPVLPLAAVQWTWHVVFKYPGSISCFFSHGFYRRTHSQTYTHICTHIYMYI